MPTPGILADPRLRRAALDPRLIAWSLWQGALWPWVRANAWWRKFKRRGHRWGVVERTSKPHDHEALAALHARPGPHVVFLGPGSGEFVMMRRVADALRERRPDVKVSHTMRDDDAIENIRGRFRGMNVAWYPTTGYFATLRWLAVQRPDVLVLTEGYRYPTLIQAAKRFGTRVALMNGRCRRRKSMRNPLRRPFYRWQFDGFAAMAMQRPEYADAARPFVSPGCAVVVSGDLKTDLNAPTLPAAQAESLRAWLETGLPVVAAGSTDNLEEERMVLAAFQSVCAQVPCRLLLAPRQTRDLGALPDEILRSGLGLSFRSKGDSPADVLLLDTQGELSSAYRACAAAYVGGAYAKRGGGHNVLEPLAWGVPVAYGMERGHFEAIQRLAEEHGVGTRIADDEALAAFWLRFLEDPAERERVGRTGQALVEASRGAVAKTVAMLEPLLGDAHGGER